MNRVVTVTRSGVSEGAPVGARVMPLRIFSQGADEDVDVHLSEGVPQDLATAQRINNYLEEDWCDWPAQDVPEAPPPDRVWSSKVGGWVSREEYAHSKGGKR